MGPPEEQWVLRWLFISFFHKTVLSLLQSPGDEEGGRPYYLQLDQIERIEAQLGHIDEAMLTYRSPRSQLEGRLLLLIVCLAQTLIRIYKCEWLLMTSGQIQVDEST